MEIKTARRKTFDVSYVIVTEENMLEVAEWCGGTLYGFIDGSPDDENPYIKVTDKNAISTRQAKAYVDDYILKMSETGSSFKAFTEKAFKKSYEEIVGKAGHKTVARSAVSGEFVSHEEAEANPETTVVETIAVESEFPEGQGSNQPYWEVHHPDKDDPDVTVTHYFNASGIEITKAEFDAWGK